MNLLKSRTFWRALVRVWHTETICILVFGGTCLFFNIIAGGICP